MDLKDLPLSSVYRDDAVRDGRAQTLEERQAEAVTEGKTNGNGSLAEVSMDGVEIEVGADGELPTSASVRHQRSRYEDELEDDDDMA